PPGGSSVGGAKSRTTRTIRPPRSRGKRLPSMHRPRPIVSCLILATSMAVGAVVGGCEKPEARTALSYTPHAKRAYDEAMEEFQSHNWIESQSLFREVKRKYHYSKYAKLAELRIADADFEQEKYAEAIRGYRQFVHDHRSDAEEVGYARSRIAEA